MHISNCSLLLSVPTSTFLSPKFMPSMYSFKPTGKFDLSTADSGVSSISSWIRFSTNVVALGRNGKPPTFISSILLKNLWFLYSSSFL